ncbi:hypothetical protein VNO77_03811 [Canavalia gladiata]|uniref:Uncharacterized protein n=1 Tax=Canavalia gladiata TaxID=3824 RepID=A0AAN9N0J3_CANGL
MQSRRRVRSRLEMAHALFPEMEGDVDGNNSFQTSWMMRELRRRFMEVSGVASSQGSVPGDSRRRKK